MRPSSSTTRWPAATLGVVAAATVAWGLWPRDGPADEAGAVPATPSAVHAPAPMTPRRTSAAQAEAPRPAAWRLIEVGRHPVSGRAAAVLGLEGEEPAVRAIGDSLGAGLRLRAVHAGHVEVERGGDVLRLPLVAQAQGGSSARRLAPLHLLRHGAAAQESGDAVEREPDVVAVSDGAGPRRSATQRAVERMRERAP